VATDLPVYIGHGAVARLIQYCEDQHLGQFTLVADGNTYPALGQAVETAFKGQGFDVKTIVLAGQEIIADEHHIVQVLVRADRSDRVYLAVGSGTITDIVRFVSHRTKADFISVPTAPSVDGYTSPGAPLVIGRLKQTVPSHPPVAVFADLPTLCVAPRPMIAAGFGDMLGKYTALADWKLGHLLWDEPYSEQVAERAWRALQECVRHTGGIGAAEPEAVRSLMAGLAKSGLCMLEAGNSRPAAGAEHYLSHYWELKLLREGRPAILHGAKVGVACILIAEQYEQVRQFTREQAIERLKGVPLPERGQEVAHIRAGYGPIADQVITGQAPFLDLSEHAYEQLKQKIIAHWADIQEIAMTVPPTQELIYMLRLAGGPTDTRGLGLGDEEVAQGLEYAHYFRNRFSVTKLKRMLGL
jgi:glycerol-1-phosphate dehydrogenase [NAD(P)+]